MRGCSLDEARVRAWFAPVESLVELIRLRSRPHSLEAPTPGMNSAPNTRLETPGCLSPWPLSRRRPRIPASWLLGPPLNHGCQCPAKRRSKRWLTPTPTTCRMFQLEVFIALSERSTVPPGAIGDELDFLRGWSSSRTGLGQTGVICDAPTRVQGVGDCDRPTSAWPPLMRGLDESTQDAVSTSNLQRSGKRRSKIPSRHQTQSAPSPDCRELHEEACLIVHVGAWMPRSRWKTPFPDLSPQSSSTQIAITPCRRVARRDLERDHPEAL